MLLVRCDGRFGRSSSVRASPGPRKCDDSGDLPHGKELAERSKNVAQAFDLRAGPQQASRLRYFARDEAAQKCLAKPGVSAPQVMTRSRQD